MHHCHTHLGLVYLHSFSLYEPALHCSVNRARPRVLYSSLTQLVTALLPNLPHDSQCPFNCVFHLPFLTPVRKKNTPKPTPNFFHTKLHLLHLHLPFCHASALCLGHPVFWSGKADLQGADDLATAAVDHWLEWMNLGSFPL